MHLPLPALVIPWLADAGGLVFLPGGLLAFGLACRAIADMWTSGAVEEQARPVWIAALVILAPVALIAYWWLHLRPRLPTPVTAPPRASRPHRRGP